jgi:hypothetical protein
MTEYEIKITLTLHAHSKPDEHKSAFRGFVQCMKDKQYGRDPLIQAWEFFVEGYELAADEHY